MAQPDSINLRRLSYDSDNESAQFSFNGWRGGKPFSVSGGVNVLTPGDQQESQVRELSKAAIAKLLRDLADTL
ncbi:hypothetical protein C7441_12175 [Pseudaminobacter salicylatoxidans]|uniref:Uncharacterized protein n=1 Tax=Pseudaminobacter salicylatoxidans TaxID=93369 RepID=A0A316BQR6_PSESE|nr:hypothetical protein [Pseudaminobacter salicylatoxidans]PWJ75292.1 hypothetical protein C7441_12175 [Pseudaminobacter salicylatoxidans]